MGFLETLPHFKFTYSGQFNHLKTGMLETCKPIPALNVGHIHRAEQHSKEGQRFPFYGKPFFPNPPPCHYHSNKGKNPIGTICNQFQAPVEPFKLPGRFVSSPTGSGSDLWLFFIEKVMPNQLRRAGREGFFLQKRRASCK